MNKAIVMAALAAPVLAACYPMEQAPLVYSSKSTIGVGVTAGTPDNPGLDLTLGFRETNVALVPVAVAKYCRFSTAENCQSAFYALQVIKGGKIDSVVNSEIKAQLDAARAAALKLNKDITDLDTAKKSAESNLQDLRKREQAGNILVAVGLNATAGEDEAIAKQRASALVDMTATANVAKLTLATEQSNLQKITEVLNQKAAELATQNGAINRLSGSLSADSQSGRDDSLSVYGTFKGGANGDSQGGGLTGGKVFATGIAAQNLSEHAAIAECLAAVGLLAKEIKGEGDAAVAANVARNSLLADAAEVCRSHAKNQDGG